VFSLLRSENNLNMLSYNIIMLKTIFIIIMGIHGLIHLMGFLKAFDLATLEQLTQSISKPIGILWLTTTILFLVSIFLFVSNKEWWWIVGLLAVIVSQVVIVTSWSDAKFGTIPNIIILLVIVASAGVYFFEQDYKNDVSYNLRYNNDNNETILTEKDIEDLPLSVQKYLRYVGVIGKPKTKNFYAVFEGQMRDKQKEFSFSSEQYNFFKEPSRLFFMKGKIFGITVPGYHKYMKQEARMDIKLFGFIPLVKLNNEVMFKSETVTTFAELCYYAPSLLANKNIVWDEIDNFTAKATFVNKNTKIVATLHFNEKGQLINFISDDRTDISDMKQHRFSVPVSEYKTFEGQKVPTEIKGIWHYPEGDFVYANLILKNIEFNIDKKI